VPTAPSEAARILMILFPARPSRWNLSSMPSARSEVCAPQAVGEGAWGFGTNRAV
jgi:hypothetical protein